MSWLINGNEAIQHKYLIVVWVVVSLVNSFIGWLIVLVDMVMFVVVILSAVISSSMSMFASSSSVVSSGSSEA